MAVETGTFVPPAEFTFRSGNTYTRYFSDGSGSIPIAKYALGISVTITYVVQMSTYTSEICKAHAVLYDDYGNSYHGELTASAEYMNAAQNRFSVSITITLDNRSEFAQRLDKFELYLDSFKKEPSTTQIYTLSKTAITWTCTTLTDEAHTYRQGLYSAPTGIRWSAGEASIVTAPGGTQNLYWDPADVGINNSIDHYSVYRTQDKKTDGSIIEPHEIHETSVSLTAPTTENKTWYYRVAAFLKYNPNPTIDSDGTDWSKVSTYSGWDASLTTTVGDLAKSTLTMPSSALKSTSILINWTKVQSVTNNDLQRYELLVKAPGSSSFSVISGSLSSIDATKTSETLVAPSTLGVYSYKIRAVGTRSSSESDVVSLTVYTNPDKPTNVKISSEETTVNGVVTLSWSPPSSDNSLAFNKITGFNVYSSTSATGPWNKKETETPVVYNSTQSTYTYQVTASSVARTYKYFIVRSVGTIPNTESSNSSYVQLLAKNISSVVAPSNVTITPSVMRSTDSAILSWTGAAPGDNNDIVGYQVYRSTSENSGYVDTGINVPTSLDSGSTTIRTENVPAGTIYYYKIKTLASGGSTLNSDLSVRSAMVRINTAPSAPVESYVSPAVYSSGDITLGFRKSSDPDPDTTINYYAEYKLSTATQWKSFGSVAIAASDSETFVEIKSATPGTDTTVSDGSIIQFRVRAEDNLGATSSYTVFSQTVTKLGSGGSGGSDLIQIDSQGSTYSASPAILISNLLTSPIMIESSDPGFGSARTIQAKGKTVFRAQRTSIPFTITNISTGESQTFIHSFSRLSASFVDNTLLSKMTHVKADHINQLRERVNTVRKFYGLDDYVWPSGSIVSGVTSLGLWSVHISELRTAIGEILQKINSFGTSESVTWTEITQNKPSITVMNELRQAVRSI